MSCLQKTYTQETKWLRVWKQDLKLKLSSMLSFTEQEMQRSELLLEEAQKMVNVLNKDFSEIHLLLKIYENELVAQVAGAISEDLMEEGFTLDQNTLH